MNFRPASYRFPLEREPLGGLTRRFEIKAVAGRIVRERARRVMNATEMPLQVDLVVRVGYSRMGGDLGRVVSRGDRLGANITASEDMLLVVDALIDVRNWNSAVTKIREVRFVGMEQVVSNREREIWRARFVCEYTARWEMAAE